MWVFHGGDFVAVEEEAQGLYLWIGWRICEGMLCVLKSLRCKDV